MPAANWRYLIVTSLLAGLVWQIHCVPTLPHGTILCFSDQSGRTGAEVEGTLYLSTEQVKAKVIETYSESNLKHFVEKIPRFYKSKSTVFTDLDQTNSMKDDYILMNNQLQRIKSQCESTSPKSMGEDDFNQHVSKTIKQLEGSQKLIQMGIQDKICKMNKMKDQGAHKETKSLGIGEDGPLKKKAKMTSTSSETACLSNLSLDLVEEISQRVCDGQVDELSGILHGIPLLRDNDQKILKEGNELSLELQNIIFQQVGYMYKQKMISKEAFEKFCQSKTTVEIAVFNMVHTDQHYEIFQTLNPVTLINEWTSEYFRKIYEVLNKKNQRYFSYLTLKAINYKNMKIGNVDIESLMQEDTLLHILEDLVSRQSKNSASIMNLGEFINQHPNYLQIKNSVQELISRFQESEYNKFKELDREWSFKFLYFIHNHYGLEILGLETGDKFAEKMSLMSSSFHLWRELRNIDRWLEERETHWNDTSEPNKIKFGEEILMIYKLSTYLISKHQSLFFDSEMSKYCRTTKLNSIVNRIERFINKIIHQHEYYYHLNS